MIRVSVNGHEVNLEELSPSWLHEQIEGRRGNQASVCVQVFIEHGGLNMVLSTPGCASSGNSSPRDPTMQEQEIFELWEKRGMREASFNVGQLIAFLNQLKGRI